MDLIKLIRNTQDISEIKIMVGGRPFLLAPKLWKKIGADGYSHNAVEAINLADEIISS